jgi:hypothetical protein
MRDESGMELDWFWRDWVFTTARLDQAVDSVSRGADGVSVVHLSNRGTMAMPATLRLTFAGGSTQDVKLPIEMWNLSDRFDYRVPGSMQITRVDVDPRAELPDVDRGNNRWPR